MNHLNYFKSVKLYAALVIALFINTIAVSQDKMLSFDETAGMNPAIFPGYLRNLQWRSNSQFTFIYKDALVEGNIKSTQRDTILKLQSINEALQSINMDKLKRFPGITWNTENSFLFFIQKKYVLYDLKMKTAAVWQTLPDNAENIEFSDNKEYVAYTIDNNLYIAAKTANIQITNDGDKGIVNGQSVHRSEFGINKGTFWSPKSNYLAFYRMDETMVTDYPLVDVSTRVASLKNIKYPMAGMKSHHVTLGVYNIASKKTTWLQTGEPLEQYLTNITWNPDEKFIYIAVVNREQNHVWLKQFDATTGNFVKILFEETHPKYVEPESGLYFLPDNSGKFLWLSERDGYNHIYLYDNTGKLLKQLTNGNWAVTNIIKISPDAKEVFIEATKDEPISQNIYKVNIESGAMIKISPVNGQHNAMITENGQYIIDVYSNTQTASVYQLLDSKGKLLQTLLEDVNPLKDYKLGTTKIFTIKANDGSDLYCRMITPPDFDSTKKYPVIVYVYGGPHAQLITNSWLAGAGLFLNLLAQQGYVVFTLDNHGSSNRGRDFEQAIHRNLGKIELEDQLLGISHIKKLPYIDANRIGVHGWSYGGFMTTTMMLKAADVFKVGVAGGPVIDWKYYEIMYGERYMDTPDENPDGYNENCLLNYAGQLKGKLLIIHGDVDPTVVWQHSLSFVKACVDKGIILDYFVYPGHEHNVRGKDRAHLNKKIYTYFKDYL